MRFNSFYELIEHYADENDLHPALIFDKNGVKSQMSYYELLKAVEAKTDELEKDGKTCLGIFCSPTVECIVTVFAAVRAKKQVVLLDDSLSDETIQKQIASSDIDSLWSADETADDFTDFLTAGVEKDAGRILFFTSGTTSMSKVVVLNEKSLCSSAYNGSAILPLERDDILLCLLPLSHVFGFVCSLLWGLSCGSSVALSRGARSIMTDFAYFTPTAVSLVPMLLGFFMKCKVFNEELKLILIGAGDCPEMVLNAAKRLGKKVCFGYGLTETSSGVALSVSGDSRAMEICPDDSIKIASDGEILIHAPTCIMEGYYKDTESTQEAIKDGYLHSGDLGYLDSNGRLHITGRKKEMLVLPSGTKIFLPEYEAALSRALGNSELAVILLNERPVLVINEKEEARERVLEIIKEEMKKHPRANQVADVIFTENKLPRTATGKIKRWEIQKTEEEKNGKNDKG
ncbi:MAG: acyl--CoA ligase [Clostridiales bacterium]|nr:acyl--CoA ligase [Clostridiales bacterium]